MASHNQLPIPVKRAPRKLGSDIRDARRRRRIPTQVMAERAGVSRTTLLKVEKGEPGVSFGTLATVFEHGDLQVALDLWIARSAV